MLNGRGSVGQECAALVDKCKHEAKQLVEFTATRRKIHWSHPSFIAFCVSVEDILSYEVRHKYHSGKGKAVTSSGRVLQELGKTYPEAASLFNRCFEGGSGAEQEDYAKLQIGSVTERKILWIRVALVDGKLQGVVEQLIKKRRSFYSDKSVLCHPVYGEIFQYLIDGPCAVKYSRLKTSDISFSNPSPAEIVRRHNQVLSIAASSRQPEENGVAIATEQAWDHVQSLYQHSYSTCLFGKNNILVKPAGFTDPLQGYLTLQRETNGLVLKWIPNTLLKDASNATSSLWQHVLSVEIVTHIAHIHCHRTPGKSAEMILIGYDGIALPPILFPHQPSLFMFLECLENSLLPQGCLEPPLWYIKTHATRSRSRSSSLLRSFGSPKRSSTKQSKSKGVKSSAKVEEKRSEEEDKEWYETIEVWNQVFRVRYSSKSQNGSEPAEEEGPVIRATPPTVRTLPLNITPYSPSADTVESSGSASASDDDDDLSPLDVTVEKPGSLARKDWEKFQSKVSKQLLARYFYSWLSYCRHMVKVRASVAHMVSTETMFLGDDHTHKDTPLSEERWTKLMSLPAESQKAQWDDIIKTVYHHGVEHSIRKEVWPYILGVFPIGCSEGERAAILSQATADYQSLLKQWKVVESRQKEIQIRAAMATNGFEDVRSRSPSLSSVSAGSSVTSSPGHSPKPASSAHDTNHATGQPIADNAVSSSPKKSHDHKVKSHDPEEQFEKVDLQLDAKGEWFVRELFNVDKDIPRLDREYWFFKDHAHLVKVRNVVCCYVWTHMSEGYSQGMCDLLAPIMVVMDNEALSYACYLKMMESAIKLFPPNTGMNNRLANIQALLQVNEADYYQYLSERPMGDGLFYCYRWLLVCFKREFSYEQVFLLWETIWTARLTVTHNFEEFLALAIMKQFKTAIMDAHLDPSDILNLFTDLAEKHAINCKECIGVAQRDIAELQSALTKKDC